jgi:ribonuclease VapC
VIVVDTSAIVAIFAHEPETSGFLDVLASVDGCSISAANVLEVSIVIRLRKALPPEQSERWLDDFLTALNISTMAVDDEVLTLARRAHVQFGKGMGHPAQLNFGDCFSYALARSLDVPLLYKGGDFALTDIRSAL